MMCPPLFSSLVAILLGAAGGASVESSHPPDFPTQVEGLREISRQSYPETRLRGYGRLSAEEVRYAARSEKQASASLLAIRTVDAEQARLVEAKFAGDLRTAAGTRDGRLAVGERPFPCANVEGQGSVAVARFENSVWVAAARHPGSLVALVAASRMLAGIAPTVRSEMPVPLYLDSWDRYGFRFYYRAWETPKGVRWPSYPVLD
jgi:hypothetical protein